jgi:hypothetical protein
MKNPYPHSLKYTIERRKDKYGQNIRLKCKCGIVTNWHTEKWKAEEAMYQLHNDTVTCHVCKGSKENPFGGGICQCCYGAGTITRHEAKIKAEISRDILTRLKEREML